MLGGGDHLNVSESGTLTGHFDEDYDYSTGASFLLGQQVNDPAVAAEPQRFGMWGLATEVVFFPSIIDTQGGVAGQATRLKHFRAYVHGAMAAELDPR